jgi:flavin-dependent dehydrogenase
VIRSESDEMLFRHAEKEGAKVFDATEVSSLSFEPYEHEGFTTEEHLANPGRPVSATWSRKDGSSGTIKFGHIIDASGRNGLISTKYLKNRRFNEGLKNIANWTYWKGAKPYKKGEKTESSPFFEALKGEPNQTDPLSGHLLRTCADLPPTDGSGWVWAIPLHNGTLSVGVVARQDIFFSKKKESGLDSQSFYKEYLKLVPQINELISEAEIVAPMKQASDWSYSANAYAGPHFRLIGDAGCFVDPYFSSGVHLALNSGLSAAVSIQAVRRGQCDELAAAKWHTTKVSEGYTRFLLLVMSVQRQLRMKETQILTTEEEEGFDMAFKEIQPVIQGVADTRSEDAEVQKHAIRSVDFALGSFDITPERQAAVIDKIDRAQDTPQILEKLTPDEVHILSNIVSRTFEKEKDELNLTNFTGDVIGGLAANMVRGQLGLVKRDTKTATGLNDSKKLETITVSQSVEQQA